MSCVSNEYQSITNFITRTHPSRTQTLLSNYITITPITSHITSHVTSVAPLLALTPAPLQSRPLRSHSRLPILHPARAEHHSLSHTGGTPLANSTQGARTITDINPSLRPGGLLHFFPITSSPSNSRPLRSSPPAPPATWTRLGVDHYIFSCLSWLF